MSEALISAEFVRFGGEWSDASRPRHESYRAFLFGHLLKLAAPVIKHYRSDLYHDAFWIKEHVTEVGFVFYWSVREGGTSIGTDKMLVASYSRAVYEIRLDVRSFAVRQITVEGAPM